MSITLRCVFPPIARISGGMRKYFNRVGLRIDLVMNSHLTFCRKDCPPKSLSSCRFQRAYTSIGYHEPRLRFCTQFHRLIDYLSKFPNQYPSRNFYFYSGFIPRNTTRNLRFRSADSLRAQKNKSLVYEFHRRFECCFVSAFDILDMKRCRKYSSLPDSNSYLNVYLHSMIRFNPRNQ